MHNINKKEFSLCLITLTTAADVTVLLARHVAIAWMTDAMTDAMTAEMTVETTETDAIEMTGGVINDYGAALAAPNKNHLTFSILLSVQGKEFSQHITMNKLKCYTIIGTIFVTIAGTLSHFVYECSGNNFILGYFFPVSESTWEHMKLCFFPMLIYSLFMNRKFKYDYPCITSALPFGILLGTFLIPVIFYTYTGIIGRNFLFLDITTFVFSVLLAFVAVYRLTLSCKTFSCTPCLWLFVLAMTVCFFIFTYLPPDIGLFIAPAE